MRFEPAFDDFLQPQDAKPFEIEEFHNTMQCVMEIAHGTVPDAVPDPSTKKLTIEMGDGDIQQLAFTNSPLNRLGFAVMQKYRNDKMKGCSFLWRFFAFLDVVREGLPEGYCRKATVAGQPDHIHPAVIELIATMPLNRKGKVDRKKFIAELRKRPVE